MSSKHLVPSVCTWIPSHQKSQRHRHLKPSEILQSCWGPSRRGRQPFWPHIARHAVQPIQIACGTQEERQHFEIEQVSPSCNKRNWITRVWEIDFTWEQIWYIDTNLRFIIFTQNVLPSSCNCHDPSRGICVESGTDVGLGLKLGFVNTDWKFETVMIERMAITKLWKTCHVWLIRNSALSVLAAKVPNILLSLGYINGRGEDSLQQISYRYVGVLILW